MNEFTPWNEQNSKGVLGEKVFFLHDLCNSDILLVVQQELETECSSRLASRRNRHKSRLSFPYTQNGGVAHPLLVWKVWKSKSFSCCCSDSRFRRLTLSSSKQVLINVPRFSRCIFWGCVYLKVILVSFNYLLRHIFGLFSPQRSSHRGHDKSDVPLVLWKPKNAF